MLTEEKIMEEWYATVGGSGIKVLPAKVIRFAKYIEAAVREEQAVEIAKLRESNAELLEGMRLAAKWARAGATGTVADHCEELIAKHGGK